MKKSSFIYNLVIVIAAFVISGCGGGGDNPIKNPPKNPPSQEPPALQEPRLSGNSTILGDLKQSDITGLATLKLDIDSDNSFNSKYDKTLQTPINEGKFEFFNIPTLEDKELKGQLIVEVEGYAPFQMIVTLHKDDSLTIDAHAALNKPLFKQSVKLSGAQPGSVRSGVIEFGIKQDGNKLKPFARLLSLSQFKAMAEGESNVSLGDGSITSYYVDVSSIPQDVEIIEATMQAFDSTKEKDLQNFPGEFKGVGLNGNAKANGEVVGLESIAFDYIKFTDQNGKKIEFKKDKLNPNAGLVTGCRSYWVRRLNAPQMALLNRLGYDEGDDIPIWSNDNSSRAWKFVGNATFLKSESKFKVCIDNWESGYLNCDSPFTFVEPKNICINAVDQFNRSVDLYFYAKNNKTNRFSYQSLHNGKGTLFIEDSDDNLTDWSIKYKGEITGWQFVDVDKSQFTRSDIEGCYYDFNLTLITPYTKKIYVTAKDYQGNLKRNTKVYVRSKEGTHYYYKEAITDENATAVFNVEPNVLYEAVYKNGKAEVKVNGRVDYNETDDGGSYAKVIAQEVDLPPNGYVNIYNYKTILKGITKTLTVGVSARDYNNDSLRVVSIKLDGNEITLANKIENGSIGYLWVRGDLNVTNLNTGTHTITFIVSDKNNNTATFSKNFSVLENRAPNIYGAYLRCDNRSLYTYGETIFTKPATNCKIYPYINEPDGDNIEDVKIYFDGNQLNPITPEAAIDNFGYVDINIGDHNVTIEAKDSHGKSATLNMRIVAQNRKPIITSYGISHSLINIHTKQFFEAFAYVYDPDYDGIREVVLSDGNNTFNLSRVYGNYYKADINATKVGVGVNKVLTFRAYDNANPSAVSEEKNVTITIINQSLPPRFIYSLQNKRVHIGNTVNYTVEANDPEGYGLNIVCSVDNSAVKEVNASYMTFSVSNLAEGNHTIKCIAKDIDDLNATTTATLEIYNEAPNVSVTPSQKRVSLNKDVNFTCNATDPDTPLTYGWKVDGNDVNVTTRTITLNYNSEGNHTIKCIASDKYGKAKASNEAKLYVENRAPNFIYRLQDKTVHIGVDVNYTVEAQDPDGDVISIVCKLDNNQIKQVNGNIANFVLSNLSEGEHNVTCQVTDIGGKSDTTNAKVVVYNEAPEVIIEPEYLEVGLNQDATFECNATDPDTPITYKWFVDGTQSSVTTRIITLNYGNESNHSVKCVAQDKYGKEAEVAVLLKVLNHAPEFSMGLTNKIVHIGNSVNYAVEAIDNDANDTIKIVCKLDNNQTLVDVNSSTTSFDLNNLNEERVYNVKCIATDSGGKTGTTEANVTVTNDAPDVTLTPMSKTVYIDENVTFECNATDQDTPISYEWIVDGNNQNVTGGTLTLSYSVASNHTIVCKAYDSYGKSAQKEANLYVVENNGTKELIIKTKIEGIYVTLHDANNSYAKIDSKTTDSNGEARFTLPSTQSRVTFSLGLDPKTVASQQMVFEVLKRDAIKDAFRNCQTQEINITQCQNASWCDMLENNSSVPAWVIDAAMIVVDDNNTLLNSSDVDTNSDGQIDVSEVYSAALQFKDKDNSNNIDWGELEDDNSIEVRIYEGVPIKTYEFDLLVDNDNKMEEEGYGGIESLMCTDLIKFNIQVTNAQNRIESLEVQGSGFAYASANGNDTFGTQVIGINKDLNGNYDFMSILRDANGAIKAIELLLDKNNSLNNQTITYDASNLTPPTMTQVTFTNVVEDGFFDIIGTKGGIMLDYKEFVGQNIFKVYNNSALRYVIKGEKWVDDKVYRQYDYYGDGTLHETYDASNYPMLNVDANITQGSINISGANLDNIDASKFAIEGENIDYETVFEFKIYRFANVRNGLDYGSLDIGNMFDAPFANSLNGAINAAAKESVSVKMFEAKDYNWEWLVDKVIYNDKILGAIKRRTFEARKDFDN